MESQIVILRRVYLDVVEQVSDAARRVQCCAAKLIEYFIHWNKWKQKAQRTQWIYQPLKKIHQDLMEEHSLHVIREAINVLVDTKIIERRHNPNEQDKTWQYKVNVTRLELLLNTEHGSSRSERPAFTVVQQTQISNTNIKATTTEDVVEKEKIEQEQEQADISATVVNNIQVNSDVAVVGCGDNSSAAARLEIVKAAGITLNPQIKAMLLGYSIKQVESAVAHYRKVVKARGERNNPAGWLNQCLKYEWYRETDANTKEKYPPGFLDAYQQMCDRGLVVPELPENLPTVMNEINVYIKSTNLNCKPWEPNYIQVPWREINLKLEANPEKL